MGVAIRSPLSIRRLGGQSGFPIQDHSTEILIRTESDLFSNPIRPVRFTDRMALADLPVKSD